MRRIACIFLLGLLTSLVFGSSRYELAATVEIKSGIRLYAETTYSFYEVKPGGVKILKWRRHEGGKYSHYWLSPSGRVWILTDSLPGPGGGSITLRDVTGDVLGRWQAWNPFPARSGAYMDMDMGTTTYSDPPATIGVAKVLRANVAEELVLPWEKGTEVHLLAFWQKGQTQPTSAYQQFDPRKGKASLLETALSDPAYDVPTYERPSAPRASLMLWRAKSLNGKRKDLVWLLPMWNSPASLMTLSSEQPLDHYPDSIETTPGGSLLIFDFFDRTARMTVMDFSTKLAKKFDLLALGKFGSVTEAKSSLRWRSPLVPSSRGWAPASQMTEYSTYGRDQVELTDARGRRYLFTFTHRPLTAKVEITSGILARRPKDLYSLTDWKLLSEKIVSSHNGKYKLRLRHLASQNGMSPKALTLLARVQDNGKTADVEMWSRTTYQDVPFMGVTDSGRVVDMEIGRIKTYDGNDSIGHMADTAALYAWGPDGNQIAGIDPLQRWGLNGLQDLRKRVQFKGIALTSIGKPEAITTAGIPTPAWPIEQISVPIKGAPSKMFYILGSAGMPQIHVVEDQEWVRTYIQRLKGQR